MYYENYLAIKAYCTSITLLLFVTAVAHAQSPGGVPSLQLWLKADEGVATNGPGLVTSWTDQSFNAEVFTPPSNAKRPTFQDGSVLTNGTNYNPAIDFYEDGNPDYLTSVNNGTIAQTWFFHHRAEGYSLANVGAGYAISSGVQDKNILRIFPNINTLFSGNIDDIARSSNSNIYQFSEIGDYNLSNKPAISNYKRLSVYSPTEPFTVGWSGDASYPNRKWQGDINEVIIFSTSLTLVQTLKVDSYLAIKYGITLSNDNNGNGTNFEFGAVNEGDYLATNGAVIWDANSINSGYHNEIIGIGRDDVEELYQKQSHTFDDTARIYIDNLQSTNINNSGVFSSDGSYVVMGDNRGKLCATIGANAEIPLGCMIYSRIEREWKVIKTNFSQVYNNDFTLDACAILGSINVAQLRLLVDDDGDFSNGGTSCYYNGDGTGVVISYSNPVITISNISNTHIPDNSIRFITIASADQATPLPIELAKFNVECHEDGVMLSWLTSSEFNNDYFTIERSMDGINFEFINTIDGAGSSTTPIFYSWIDEAPIRGTSIYRLSQTDFNGDIDVSQLHSVNCNRDADITIYPNPFEDKFQIISKYSSDISVIDNTGKLVLTQAIVAGDNSIHTDGLASGIYMLFFTSKNGNPEVYKLVKL